MYTRGNNKDNIFLEERNYTYFLQLYRKHVSPFADTYAYCLLRNHFHLLIKIKERFEPEQTSQVFKTCEVSPAIMSKQFATLFNAYTKAINKAYGRTGSLFQERFGRIVVNSPHYFTRLVYYIHFNPQKHGFVDSFKEWPYSSYHSLTALTKQTNLKRDEVLEWFGGVEWYQDFHQMDEEGFASIRDVIGDD